MRGLFYGIGHQPNSGIYGGQLELDEAGYVQVGSDHTKSVAHLAAMVCHVTMTTFAPIGQVPAASLLQTVNRTARLASHSQPSHAS